METATKLLVAGVTMKKEKTGTMINCTMMKSDIAASKYHTIQARVDVRFARVSF